MCSSDLVECLSLAPSRPLTRAPADMARLLISCIVIGTMYAISTGLMSLLAPDATAFLPVPQGTDMSRRQMVQGLAASAAAAGAKTVWADNQGEKIKAMRTWGPDILKLKDAVEAGDMKTVLANDKKFKLLTTYWRNNKNDYKEMNELYEGIMDAAYAGKKDEVKDLYGKYISRRELDAFAKLPPPDNYHIWNPDNSMTTR